MTDDLAALAAAAIARGAVQVTRVPAGARVLGEYTHRRSAPARHDNSRVVSTVVDHRGVEHGRNAEGEWLY